MIKVTVPATTANVGPGFDCLGMALNLYTNVMFEEIERGLIIEGCHSEYQNENNLIYQSMLKIFEMAKYNPKGIKITIDSNIPVSRGLGSSAACILAGIMGANEMAEAQLTKSQILKIATQIEGHPDNVAPALFGGMIVSVYDNDEVYFSKIPLNDSVDFYALIPDFTLSTSEARSVLPKQIPFEDATFNIGRVALMIASFFSGNLDLLNVSIKDKLHQKYRGALIYEYDTIMEELDNLQVKGAFLSGAGPTIIAITDKNETVIESAIANMVKNLKEHWTFKKLCTEVNGAIVTRG
ncbi:MAG TPA: homoserine kinase [Clostridia bacterium]|nr:homoserine kinase [Clostridia bacterium]